MKHSDLKVGMKVKRVTEFSNYHFATTNGNICTVKNYDDDYFFSIEEDDLDEEWCAEYFEPVEEIKEETMTNKITLDKKYRTRCGYPARVLCVDMNDTERPVVALVDEEYGESIYCLTPEGKFYASNCNADLDLIEVSPWEDFKKDDKVMVRDFISEEWFFRHFSHVDTESGRVYCYNDGKTSFTTKDTSSWKYCRKPAQEELEG